MREEWRAVTEPDFENSYLVSDQGRAAKILRGARSKQTGYVAIILAKKGVAYRGYRLHQLVARAFLGDQPEGTVVNHKDGDKTNNKPGNLEFITQKENVLHGISIGRRKTAKNPVNGQFSPVLSVDQVGEIKALIGSGTPLYRISEEYKVTTQAIRSIKMGRNWNRVPAKS